MIKNINNENKIKNKIKNKKLNDKIFISVASYRDKELIPTLKDLIIRAAQPADLNFSVCWQDNNDISLFEKAGFTLTGTDKLDDVSIYSFIYQQAKIDIISVSFLQSKGACWARAFCEKLYKDQYYFMQIDSHCRVTDNWDTDMKADLDMLNAHIPLPIISTYPPNYIPGPNEEESKATCVSNIKIHFRAFDEQCLPSFIGRASVNDYMMPTPFLAAGYVFTLGCFVTDIGNDPQLFFIGEEIAMAIRAYTHGYDIFHPNKTLIWHCYNRDNEPRIWNDHTQQSLDQGDIQHGWWHHDSISKARVKKLLGINIDEDVDLGRYGLGSVRTLQQFQYYSGLCFSEVKVHSETINNPDKYIFTSVINDHQQWHQQLSYHLQKVLKLQKSEVIQQSKQKLFDIYKPTCPEMELALNYLLTDEKPENLSIRVFNEQKQLLYKTTMDYQTLKTKCKGNEISFELSFQTQSKQTPTTICLCPWYKDTGWGKTTELTW